MGKGVISCRGEGSGWVCGIRHILLELNRLVPMS
jgi:hypothetical protein